MFQQLFVLFATLTSIAYGLRTKMSMALQAIPDVNCQQWLDSPAGQEYQQCENGNPGLPVPYNQTNNCELTFEDFEGYCNNSCYDVMVKAWDFFLNTSTCLDVEQDKYKPCLNDSDCPTMGDGRQRICFEGFCYNACNSTSDCNPCMEETCVTLGGNKNGTITANNTGSQGTNNTGSQGSNGTLSQGCRSAKMVFVNGSALANRTIQNTFRAQLYKLKAGCSKSENNVYCGLMDLSNQTCASLKSQWGCCASTLLPSMQYCQWLNFTNSTYNNLLNNCSWDITPCGGLDWAWQFCGFNVSSNITNSSSSSSSSFSSSSSSSNIIGTNSSSSNIIGTNSSSSSNIIGTNSSSSSMIGTNSSSSSLITPNSSDILTSNTSASSSWSGSSSFLSSGTGIGTNHTNNNNTASGKAVISWTVTIAVVLAATNILS